MSSSHRKFFKRSHVIQKAELILYISALVTKIGLRKKEIF
jgi:hypothetical protein